MPKKQDSATQKRKPVLVYIPGGGYYVGSGVSNHYGGPEYLIDQDIVLVTLNYRLAALGFLSLGTKDVPGNAGLKDQILALRWVRDNIEHFGGDPNQVTLVGNSAGSFSITMHMVSPMAQGIFHRVILMSGGLNYAEKTPSEQIYLAEREARLLNCSDTNTIESIYSCLKSASASAMTEKLYDMFEFGEDNPLLLWTYVIEKDFGQERYLLDEPFKLIEKGLYTKVPILMGITKDELAYSAGSIVDRFLTEFESDFDRVAPICFVYERNTTESKSISDALWSGYNLSHPLTKDYLPNINYVSFLYFTKNKLNF